MEILDINGVKYAIEIHQKDASLPRLFMLHGFMGDGRVFCHMKDNLAKACNPITVDLLGHGKSQKVYDPARYREEKQIADLLQLVKQAGQGAAPPYLYGYSMGGRLALKTALQAPEAFCGLMLESTNHGIADDTERAIRREADNRRARRIRKDYTGFLSKWEKLALFKSPHKTDKKLENRCKEIHLAQDPKAMAASLVGFSTGAMKPVRSAIGKYKNPALIVAGTADQKYMEISQSLASYFNEAHFCPISAGHRVHLDNPSQLICDITHFIRGDV